MDEKNYEHGQTSSEEEILDTSKERTLEETYDNDTVAIDEVLDTMFGDNEEDIEELSLEQLQADFEKEQEEIAEKAQAKAIKKAKQKAKQIEIQKAVAQQRFIEKQQRELALKREQEEAARIARQQEEEMLASAQKNYIRNPIEQPVTEADIYYQRRFDEDARYREQQHQEQLREDIQRRSESFKEKERERENYESIGNSHIDFSGHEQHGAVSVQNEEIISENFREEQRNQAEREYEQQRFESEYKERGIRDSETQGPSFSDGKSVFPVAGYEASDDSSSVSFDLYGSRDNQGIQNEEEYRSRIYGTEPPRTEADVYYRQRFDEDAEYREQQHQERLREENSHRAASFKEKEHERENYETMGNSHIDFSGNEQHGAVSIQNEEITSENFREEQRKQTEREYKEQGIRDSETQESSFSDRKSVFPVAGYEASDDSPSVPFDLHGSRDNQGVQNEEEYRSRTYGTEPPHTEADIYNRQRFDEDAEYREQHQERLREENSHRATSFKEKEHERENYENIGNNSHIGFSDHEQHGIASDIKNREYSERETKPLDFIQTQSRESRVQQEGLYKPSESYKRAEHTQETVQKSTYEEESFARYIYMQNRHDHKQEKAADASHEPLKSFVDVNKKYDSAGHIEAGINKAEHPIRTGNIQRTTADMQDYLHRSVDFKKNPPKRDFNQNDHMQYNSNNFFTMHESGVSNARRNVNANRRSEVSEARNINSLFSTKTVRNPYLRRIEKTVNRGSKDVMVSMVRNLYYQSMTTDATQGFDKVRRGHGVGFAAVNTINALPANFRMAAKGTDNARIYLMNTLTQSNNLVRYVKGEKPKDLRSVRPTSYRQLHAARREFGSLGNLRLKAINSEINELMAIKKAGGVLSKGQEEKLSSLLKLRNLSSTEKDLKLIGKAKRYGLIRAMRSTIRRTLQKSEEAGLDGIVKGLDFARYSKSTIKTSYRLARLTYSGAKHAVRWGSSKIASSALGKSALGKSAGIASAAVKKGVNGGIYTAVKGGLFNQTGGGLKTAVSGVKRFTSLIRGKETVNTAATVFRPISNIVAKTYTAVSRFVSMGIAKIAAIFGGTFGGIILCICCFLVVAVMVCCVIMSNNTSDNGKIDLSPYMKILNAKVEVFNKEVADKTQEATSRNGKCNLEYTNSSMDNSKVLLTMLAVRLQQNIGLDNPEVKSYLESIFDDSHHVSLQWGKPYSCKEGCETRQVPYIKEDGTVGLKTEKYCPGKHQDGTVYVTIYDAPEIFNYDTYKIIDTGLNKGGLIGRFIITYYCAEKYPHICNAGPPYKTATGTDPTPGRSIAVDPKVIPLGSKVFIDGHEYTAEDTGGAIDNNHIDIVVATHAEAMNKGKRFNVPVYTAEISEGNNSGTDEETSGDTFKPFVWDEDNREWFDNIYGMDWAELYDGIEVYSGGMFEGDLIVSGNWTWPVASTRITSPFGPRSGGFHKGVDIGIPIGTPVCAAGDGVVERASYIGTYGNVVYLNHAGGIQTRYAHNSQLLVKPGDVVKAGQIISKSGNTGRSTGPHLHFEFRVNGNPTDPLKQYKLNK